MTEIAHLLEELKSSASERRRRAAKKLGALRASAAGKSLFGALQKEQEDPRTWETKVRMIDALGLIGYKKAAPFLWEICKRNLPHDSITGSAAQAYVRLTRKSLRDAAPVLKLLKFGEYSVAIGACDALGYDHMIPSEKHIARILEAVKRHAPIVGMASPYYGVAVAAAGWRGENVQGSSNSA